jgi:hypothetical protein
MVLVAELAAKANSRVPLVNCTRPPKATVVVTDWPSRTWVNWNPTATLVLPMVPTKVPVRARVVAPREPSAFFRVSSRSPVKLFFWNCAPMEMVLSAVCSSPFSARRRLN